MPYWEVTGRMNIAWLGLPAVWCLCWCFHRLCSPLSSTLHLFHFIKASSLSGECASADDSFALAEISLAFQPCVSDSSDIWGSLRVLFHRESRPLSSKKSIRADAHQKTLCEVWNEQEVKADRLRSRLIQGKWWNSPSRQSRTERGTRWNFTHTSTDVNLDLSLWLSLHIKYRLVTCTSQQNVKHFTTFGAFYFYSLINVRVKDVFYYWLKNDFPVLEKLWKISEKHEKFHSLYNFFLFLCFALKYI